MRHGEAELSLNEVRRSVATHLGLPARVILPRHSLREDLGLGRIELALLAMKLEEEFQIELPFFVIEDIGTIAELSAWIDRLTSADLEPPRATGSRPT